MRLRQLDKLRTRIRKIERGESRFSPSTSNDFISADRRLEKNEQNPAWSFGMSEIDQFFPQGLSPHGLHEITPTHYKDNWACLSFALALLSRRAHHDQRPLLWCSSSHRISEFGQLYRHGLQRFNIPPERLILIETANESETVFVLEEALKSGQLCAVLGMVTAPGLTPSRRLSLMADKGQTPALLITQSDDPDIQTTSTRWQITTIPSDERLDAVPFLHQLSWQVALTRNRQGPADRNWHLEFPPYDLPFSSPGKKAFCFTRPSPFRNRKSAPPDRKANAA